MEERAMTFRIKIRGAHSQRIALDFLCSNCGPFSLTVDDRDTEGVPCVDNCGQIADRVMSAPFGAVNHVSVVRGGVAQQESPLHLNTRGLASGQTMTEYRAQREKVADEKRWREAKEYDRFVKGSG
jgi:hypothetical protein